MSGDPDESLHGECKDHPTLFGTFVPVGA